MSSEITPLVLNPDKPPEPALPVFRQLPSEPKLPDSPMLLSGTPDEATENEYVVALGAKIVQHACRIMPMKIKTANGSTKKVPMLCLNEHALAHVLKVFFGGGEVNDETLTWTPGRKEPAADLKPLGDAL